MINWLLTKVLHEVDRIEPKKLAVLSDKFTKLGKCIIIVNAKSNTVFYQHNKDQCKWWNGE